MTAREIYCVLLAVCGFPRFDGGRMIIRNSSLMPPGLLEVVRAHRDELTALAMTTDGALVEALQADLTRWIDDWENGCRWARENPKQADRAYSRLMAASNRWGGALMWLGSIEPNHPALVLAYVRLDAVAMIADAGIELEAV
jgi:hypothetical protein